MHCKPRVLISILLGSVKVNGTIDYRALRDQYLFDKYVNE